MDFEIEWDNILYIHFTNKSQNKHYDKKFRIL